MSRVSSGLLLESQMDRVIETHSLDDGDSDQGENYGYGFGFEKRLMKDGISSQSSSNVPFPCLCGGRFSQSGEVFFSFICFFNNLLVSLGN